MNDKNIVQMPDGYLNKTPLFQFILLSCLFPLWGCAAALNDILITQFKSVFSLSNFCFGISTKRLLWRLFFNCYSGLAGH
ncbi:sugar:proton symporter [Salmonella enterica subsp. enterica]|uniref:Sugar:proton symporter n=1 Tax=Salmonella enterica I TaxID=59201 RepID=A0A3S4LSN1_SALET|nr:sugar:proton symporter [Salmonella enterica subsp. enterica]